MPWKLAVFGFAVLVGVCCGEDPSDTLKITQLRKLTAGGLSLCYLDNGEKYASATLVVLDMTTPPAGNTLETSTADVAVSNCFSFSDATLETIQSLKVRFNLKTKNKNSNNKDGFGTVDVQMPATADFPAAITIYKIGPTAGKKAIRVNDVLKANQHLIIADLDPFPCEVVPCYKMDVPNSKNTFLVCIDDIHVPANVGEEVLFCTETVATTVTTEEKDEGVTTISFDHVDDDNNKVSLVSSCGQPDCSNAEMVIQKGEDVLKICPLTGLTGDCSIAVTDQITYHVFIAYTDPSSTSVVSFNRIGVINRNLVGAGLTSTVMEVTWNVNSSLNFFQIERDPVTGDAFHIADVDCKHMTDLCFVYFTGLLPSDFTVTLREITTWGTVENIKVGPNQEVSTAIKISVKEETSKENKKGKQENIMGLTLLQDPRSTDGTFQICYPASENNNSNTRYEAIVIDEDGHWIKIYQSTQEDNQMQCFSPVNLLTSSLKITKNTKLTAVIVERELDGNKVLSSGQVDIDFTALRDIKPAVDNGNNGSTSTLTIVGAAIGGIACLMALVGAAIMFVMKIKRDNDGLQYPLHRTNIEQDSSYIHGLDNPIPTM